MYVVKPYTAPGGYRIPHGCIRAPFRIHQPARPVEHAEVPARAAAIATNPRAITPSFYLRHSLFQFTKRVLRPIYRAYAVKRPFRLTVLRVKAAKNMLQGAPQAPAAASRKPQHFLLSPKLALLAPVVAPRPVPLHTASAAQLLRRRAVPAASAVAVATIAVETEVDAPDVALESEFAAGVGSVAQQVEALRGRYLGTRALVERVRASGAQAPGGLDLARVVDSLISVGAQGFRSRRWLGWSTTRRCMQASSPLRAAGCTTCAPPACVLSSHLPPLFPVCTFGMLYSQEATFLAYSTYDSCARALMRDAEALKELINSPLPREGLPQPQLQSQQGPPPMRQWHFGSYSYTEETATTAHPPSFKREPANNSTAKTAGALAQPPPPLPAAALPKPGGGRTSRPLPPFPSSPACLEYLSMQARLLRVEGWIEGVGSPGASPPRHELESAVDALLMVCMQAAGGGS
jgi:hypothetical protein